MVQAIKYKLKNEKGFTLIELLAVVVILGILAAIAVPSIMGIINNSKKDAHVANAQQMISAAKLAIAGDIDLQSGTYYLPLGYLEKQGYIETVKDPDGVGYKAGNDTVSKNTISDPNTSFVKIADGEVVSVKLVNGNRGVQAVETGYSVPPDKVKRSAVNDTVAGK